ncbi:MAG: hypothetical protein U9N34_00530, partial [Candidatus Cloacimonadota bacterium]|nr:hypothetical protein [Candidatus Cloacimonadota bacterium]
YHLERNNKIALDNLKQLTEYYKTYKELLGDFPFSSFNLVESNHITNLDNASYSTIAPRNFKNQSKFKNELLEKLIRNWIAKSTYTKGKIKMWQNAFITFLVQYYPLKNTTGAKKWREKIMEETNFVNLSPDKKKQTSYKKVIFLLIEMHKKMGEEDFFYVFKSFINSYRGSEASWEDIQLFFSMKEFAQQKEIFEFYLNENEILDITLEHISVFQDTLKFAITQNNSPQTIHLPIKITTKNNELDKEILIDKAQNQFEYFIDDKILELEIDPNSEILKKTVNEPKKLHWIAK